MSRDLKEIHPYLPKLAEQYTERKVSRREFLRTATLLGLSATAAYSIAGLPGGSYVRPAAAQTGGTVRISIRVPALDNPHTYSWVYDSNSARQVLDYLTRTGFDNITRPWLCEGVAMPADAT